MILKHKKISFVLLFILLFSFLSFSQSSDANKFIGVINVKNIGMFPYQLDFTVSGNQITGTSVTNIGNKDETSATIKGTINEKGAIEFSETNILKTGVKDKNLFLCLVNAKLSFKTVLGVETLEGDFTGLDNKNKFCGSGTIRLIRETKEITKAVETITRDNEIKKLSIVEVNQIAVDDRDVKIRIYDNGVVDGDEIQITLNGTVLIEKHTLTKEGKVYNIKVEDSSSNLLEIKTLNEGIYSPNTANIEVTAKRQIKTYNFNAPLNTIIKLKFLLEE